MNRDQLDARLKHLYTSAEKKMIRQGDTIILTMTFENGWSETDSCTFHEFDFDFEQGVEVCKQRIMQRMSCYEEYASRAYDEVVKKEPEQPKQMEECHNVYDSPVQYWEIKKATMVWKDGHTESVFYPQEVIPKAPVFEEYGEVQEWIKKYGNMEA